MENKKFKLVSDFKPTGDQPEAIDKLVEGINSGKKHQVLLGATGTGKTFVMANLIERIQRPTLVIAHNKTLTAQLCTEFQEFFPDNAVSYFVSYYDYYQPEAYIARTDTYIEKDSSINEEINKYRHAATQNLLTRRDVLVVASVSCIYGLGSREEYGNVAVELEVGKNYKRDKILRHLTDIQYTRSQLEFKRGMFHVLGDTVEVYPPSADTIYRMEFFGDELERISEADAFTGKELHELTSVKIFPAKHDVTTAERIERAVGQIQIDLKERYDQLKKMGKNIEDFWLGPDIAYQYFFELVNNEYNIENFMNKLNEIMDKYPYMFSEIRDGDTYKWLEELACFSPIIHMQQTDGFSSKHLPFTRENNLKGIIEGKKLLHAIAKSYEYNNANEDFPPKVDEIYLTFEIFSSNIDSNYHIINNLKETLEYWRKFIPMDGITLDKLL